MILATPRGDVFRRDASLGSLMALNGVPLRGDSGLTASASEIAGIPAFQQGIRIASQAVARLQLAVWRGQAPNRQPVNATWQARFFAGQPNERDGWFFTWEGTEASLTSRNNAYWLKEHDMLTGRVAAVRVQHPDNVWTRWNRQERRAEYTLRLDDGQWTEWLTSAEVLHFRAGYPEPGCVTAPSPLQLHRRTWATSLARSRSETQTYEQGSRKTVAVVFPQQITPEQSQRWREVYLESGGNNDSPVKVFGGGPQIQEIGLSFEDLQFVESQQFSIEDVGRILGVLPSLLFAATKNGDRPLTPEHEEDRWFRHGLEPRRTRIQDTIKADPDFFGVGARDYPAFTAGAIRADRDTEVRSYVALTQAGIIVPDTAAEALGFPPLPGGLGQIVQITPVGGAPNETPATPAQQQSTRETIVIPVDRDASQPTDMAPIARALEAVGAGLRQIADRPVAVEVDARSEHHHHLPEQTPADTRVDVRVPDPPPPAEMHIDVHVPEQAAPDVHIDVHVPEQPPAVVNVNAAAEPPKKLSIERNGQGWIKGATIEDA